MFTFTKWDFNIWSYRRRSKHKNTLHISFGPRFSVFLSEKHNNQWALITAWWGWEIGKKSEGTPTRDRPTLLSKICQVYCKTCQVSGFLELYFSFNYCQKRAHNILKTGTLRKIEMSNEIIQFYLNEYLRILSYIIIYWSLYLCIYQSIHLLLPASCRELCYFHSYSPML